MKRTVKDFENEVRLEVIKGNTVESTVNDIFGSEGINLPRKEFKRICKKIKSNLIKENLNLYHMATV